MFNLDAFTYFRAAATASLIDLSSPDQEHPGDDNRPMSPSDSYSSGGGGDRGGMSLEEFIRHMKEKRRVRHVFSL